MLLIVLSILWGGSFFFIGVAVKSLPPFNIVATRVTIAALTLTLVLRLLGITIPHSKELWLSFLVMGLFNNAIPFSLIVWGQTQIAAGLASILNATTPFFTLIIAQFFTQDEKITPAKIGGLVVGFLGVIVLIGPTAIERTGREYLGSTGHPRRLVFLRDSGRLCAAIPAQGDLAAGHSERSAHLGRSTADSSGIADRCPLDLAGAAVANLGCPPRPGAAFHIACLHHLLSHTGYSRRHERVACDHARTGQRGDTRHAVPERTASGPPAHGSCLSDPGSCNY